jgi:hypothetical protein
LKKTRDLQLQDRSLFLLGCAVRADRRVLLALLGLIWRQQQLQLQQQEEEPDREQEQSCRRC